VTVVSWNDDVTWCGGGTMQYSLKLHKRSHKRQICGPFILWVLENCLNPASNFHPLAFAMSICPHLRQELDVSEFMCYLGWHVPSSVVSDSYKVPVCSPIGNLLLTVLLSCECSYSCSHQTIISQVIIRDYFFFRNLTDLVNKMSLINQ